MENQELRVLKEKQNKTNIERTIILDSDYFSERLVELRNEDTGKNWSVIAKQLSQEFHMDVNSNQIQRKYVTESSLEIQVDAFAEKQFTKYIGKMTERYDRLIRITDKLMGAMDSLLDQLNEVEDVDQITKYAQIVQLIKPLHPLNQTVLSQLQFVRDEQNKISTKLMNNRKEVTDDEIRTRIYKYLPDVLKTYEDQGKIKIMDKNILK